MTPFQLVTGTLILISVCSVAYLAYISESGRLSNILMAFGLICEAVAIFANNGLAAKSASVAGVAFFAASLILLLRMLYSGRRREQ